MLGLNKMLFIEIENYTKICQRKYEYISGSHTLWVWTTEIDTIMTWPFSKSDNATYGLFLNSTGDMAPQTITDMRHDCFWLLREDMAIFLVTRTGDRAFISNSTGDIETPLPPNQEPHILPPRGRVSTALPYKR